MNYFSSIQHPASAPLTAALDLKPSFLRMPIAMDFLPARRRRQRHCLQFGDLRFYAICAPLVSIGAGLICEVVGEDISAVGPDKLRQIPQRIVNREERLGTTSGAFQISKRIYFEDTGNIKNVW